MGGGKPFPARSSDAARTPWHSTASVQPCTALHRAPLHPAAQVSVFDTIKTWGRAGYSSKVRRLGEFSTVWAAAAAAARDPDAADIDDALYGEGPRGWLRRAARLLFASSAAVAAGSVGCCAAMRLFAFWFGCCFP